MKRFPLILAITLEVLSNCGCAPAPQTYQAAPLVGPKVRPPVPSYIDNENVNREENRRRHHRLVGILRRNYPNALVEHPNILADLRTLIDTIPWAPTGSETLQIINWKRGAAHRFLAWLDENPFSYDRPSVSHMNILAMIWSTIQDTRFYRTTIEQEDVKKLLVRQLAHVQRDHNHTSRPGEYGQIDWDPSTPDVPSCDFGIGKLLIETIASAFESEEGALNYELGIQILLEQHATLFGRKTEEMRSLIRTGANEEEPSTSEARQAYLEHLRELIPLVEQQIRDAFRGAPEAVIRQVLEAIRPRYPSLDLSEEVRYGPDVYRD